MSSHLSLCGRGELTRAVCTLGRCSVSELPQPFSVNLIKGCSKAAPRRHTTLSPLPGYEHTQHYTESQEPEIAHYTFSSINDPQIGLPFRTAYFREVVSGQVSSLPNTESWVPPRHLQTQEGIMGRRPNVNVYHHPPPRSARQHVSMREYSHKCLHFLPQWSSVKELEEHNFSSLSLFPALLQAPRRRQQAGTVHNSV